MKMKIYQNGEIHLKELRYHDKKTNFIIFGGIDDVWINKMKNYI